MKKVLIITYYWPPGGGPGVQRSVKFTKYLPGFGIQPIVVTVDPKMASYPITDQSLIKEVADNPEVYRTGSFEILNFYTRLMLGGKLPQPGFANESKPGVFKKFARYLRGNFLIPDARIGWNRYALKQCRQLIKEQNIAAIFSSSPPHSTQLMALKLSEETGLPWVADLRDPWTDIYYNQNLYRSKKASMRDAVLEKMVLERADAVITVSESLKKLFVSKSNLIQPGKIHVIPNGFDLSDFPEKAETGSDIFTITYTGTMSDQYPVAGFIRAVKSLQAAIPDCRMKINLVGQIADGILKQFEEAGIHQLTEVHGYVEHAEALKAMRNASVLLLVIPDVPENEGILTGKLFEYLATRRPIIGFGPPLGDAAQIIHSCNSGQMFDQHDDKNATEWLIGQYQNFTDRKTTVAGNSNVEKYSRRSQAEQLAKIINLLARD